MPGNRSRTSVRLTEITAATVREIAALRVSEQQSRYVASNALSIAEAYFERGAWFRAIYTDEIAVGFVMLFDHTLPGAFPKNGVQQDEIGLWRLMIDRRFQGRGYGRQTLDLICRHSITRPGIARILSSYVPGPDGPEKFYMRYGFAKTGCMRNGGEEVEIAFRLD